MTWEIKAIASAISLALALAVILGWTANGWRLNSEIARINGKHAAELYESTEAALTRYESMERTKDEAIAAHAELAAKNAISAASAKRTADSLRRDLATVPDRISAATDSAAREYASAATVVLDQCTAEVAELARIADGHAADVQLILAAWPKEKAP